MNKFIENEFYYYKDKGYYDKNKRDIYFYVTSVENENIYGLKITKSFITKSHMMSWSAAAGKYEVELNPVEWAINSLHPVQIAKYRIKNDSRV